MKRSKYTDERILAIVQGRRSWFASVAEAERSSERGASITTPCVRTVRWMASRRNSLPTLSAGAHRRRRRFALT